MSVTETHIVNASAKTFLSSLLFEASRVAVKVLISFPSVMVIQFFSVGLAALRNANPGPPDKP